MSILLVMMDTTEMSLIILVSFAFFLFCSPALGSIDTQTRTDAFTVHNLNYPSDEWIEVPNPYRVETVLKFTINGTSIKTVAEKNSTAWTLTLADSSVVELSMKKFANISTVTEYNFYWPGGKSNVDREICFHYGYNDSYWYYSYQSANPNWPIRPSDTVAKTHFNFAHYPNAEVVNIVEHLFVTTGGFALLLDDQQPLFIRRDKPGGVPMMCFSVNNSTPYMISNTEPSYLDIKFRLFASENIKEVYENVANSLGYIERPSSIPDERLFQHPIWTTFDYIATLDQSKVLQFAKEIRDNHFNCSLFSIHPDWVNYYGDFSFNTTKFPDPNQMFAELNKLGFKSAVSFYDGISGASSEYEQSKKYLLKTPDSLYHYDFTNMELSRWFVQQLDRFRRQHSIDSFMFYQSAGFAASTLDAHESFVQKYPSLYSKQFATIVAEFGNTAVLQHAFKSQNLPNFIQLSNRTNNWSENTGIKSIIPTVLALSIGGYSFVVPSFVQTAQQSTTNYELFVRWVQVCTFLPSMQFSTPPWKINSTAGEIVRKFTKLHEQYAPVMIELARKRVESGSPMIRPMWYAEPNDVRTFNISDQFMLGDNMVIAPVVEVSATSRLVYLPSGNWRDQHGKNFTGQEVYNVTAPLEELPYFVRVE